MVNRHNDTDADFEVTNEDAGGEELELQEDEARTADIIKKQRATIARLEDEKRLLSEEVQRAKADFLNARRRLEEERELDRRRLKRMYIEEVLPLCDSFTTAMRNTEAWQAVDVAWRKGMEGVYAQLQQLLKQNRVYPLDPIGQPFDPNRHEAISTEQVTEPTEVDTVVTVVQLGYEMEYEEANRILIRPARVTIGAMH